MRLKLVYFQVRAKAEPAKMALAYGGIPWIDECVTSYYGEGGWPTHKLKTPWGSLPLLAVDGVEIAQTPAIVKFVAALVDKNEPGFMPSDPMTVARCDAAFFAAEELGPVNPCVNVWRGDDFTQKVSTYMQTFPTKLGNLARYLGNGPFFCGDKPTYGDFNVYHHLDNTRLLDPNALDAHANIVTFMAAVEQLPGVSDFLKARPKPVDIGTAPMLDPAWWGPDGDKSKGAPQKFR